MSVTQFYPSGSTSSLTGSSLGTMTIQGTLKTLDFESENAYIHNLDVDNIHIGGITGAFTGGTENQILTKKSNTSYDTYWSSSFTGTNAVL